MVEQLRRLLKEMDELIALESEALDKLHCAPSHSILDELHAYEDRIDTLMAEIFAIGRYSNKSN
jgi:hypothetical protein